MTSGPTAVESVPSFVTVLPQALVTWGSVSRAKPPAPGFPAACESARGPSPGPAFSLGQLLRSLPKGEVGLCDGRGIPSAQWPSALLGVTGPACFVGGGEAVSGDLPSLKLPLWSRTPGQQVPRLREVPQPFRGLGTFTESWATAQEVGGSGSGGCAKEWGAGWTIRVPGFRSGWLRHATPQLSSLPGSFMGLTFPS